MYRKTIDIPWSADPVAVLRGVRRGQWVSRGPDVRGRFVGVSRAGVVWIMWGRKPAAAWSTMIQAFRRYA